MGPTQPASVTVSPRGSNPEDPDAACTIVWLHGEHDMATRGSVEAAIARAARGEAGDLLVDLSDVTFMDASTIDALVGCRRRLGACSRSLLLRAPSPQVRRMLDVCGLADLIQPAATGPAPVAGVAAALGTWVDVPSRPSLRDRVVAPATAELLQLAHRSAVGPARASRSRSIEADRGAE